MTKETSKSAAQMRKGVLELCILRILRGGEAYTSDIIDALKAVDLLVVEGTIYPLLTRMKNAGTLTYRWVESPSGPPRKYYDMTDRGRALLEELEATWNQFVDSVNSLESHMDTTAKNAPLKS
ncbi:MAG: PadR family transcriptional regulator [Crocinitomicaceae bacterium]|nr:PadR family transcriptional regulator [Crocinitomicaceae bacterium]